MIDLYLKDAGKLAVSPGIAALQAGVDDALWIDLQSPTADEEQAIEAALRLDIPTRDDMAEIELSSRLYREGDALFLTANVLATAEGKEPELAPVTFVLAENRLITVRYHAPRSFQNFADLVLKKDIGCTSGYGVFIALLEAVVDRLADLIEGESRKLELLAKAIFAAHRPAGKAETLAVVLQRIGRAEDMNSKVAESLSTLHRLAGFLTAANMGKGQDAIDGTRLKTLVRDIRSLTESSTTQGQKILFLLDATLGVINIRQADIIKIFSVVAFVFLPPTLIASIYGMNFVHMPELQIWWAYPAALVAMLVSAVVPYLLFRAKGWIK